MDITTIAIVAIVCWAIVRLVNGPESDPRSGKKSKKAQSQLESDHAQMQQELATMSERLAVLEKIVTDEKYTLNKEFASLKD